MAQLVEHILGKDEVPGPNPGSSSRHPRGNTSGALVFYSICESAMLALMECRELLPLKLVFKAKSACIFVRISGVTTI